MYNIQEGNHYIRSNRLLANRAFAENINWRYKTYSELCPDGITTYIICGQCANIIDLNDRMLKRNQLHKISHKIKIFIINRVLLGNYLGILSKSGIFG